jgi:hypothetical protein
MNACNATQEFFDAERWVLDVDAYSSLDCKIIEAFEEESHYRRLLCWIIFLRI